MPETDQTTSRRDETFQQETSRPQTASRMRSRRRTAAPLRLGPPFEAPQPLNLTVFPDYTAANPYQSLLHDDLLPFLRLRYGSICDALDLKRFDTASRRRHAFHLHWEDAVYRLAETEAAARERAESFVRALDRFVAEGGAVFWTMHNAAPHDDRYSPVHAWIAREIALRAGRIFVHSKAAAALARERFEAAADRIEITPHGGFEEIYAPRATSQAEARAWLGAPADARVLLLFGRLRRYKGLDALLKSLRRLEAQGALAGARVLIAGRQIDTPDVADETLHDRLLVIDRFIEECEVADLFLAADAVVAPYQRILTSGAAVLAMSMGRPVVAPRLAHVAETIEDGETGFLYDPDDPLGLDRALKRALQCETLGVMGERAKTASAALRWSDASAALMRAYRGVGTERGPHS